MARYIKTRDYEPKYVKTKNRNLLMESRLKDRLVRPKTEERFEGDRDGEDGDANDYAIEKVDELRKRAGSEAKETVLRVKDRIRGQIKKTGSNREISGPSPNTGVSKGIVKSGEAVRTGKRTVKTVRRSAAVTVRTASASVRTAQAGTRTAVHTSRAAAQTAKAAAKAAAAGAKAAAKAIEEGVKTMVHAVEALIAAIAAGGWVALLIIVIILGVLLLVAVLSGAFGTGADGSFVMQTAMQDIDLEYETRIEEIKASNEYDEVVFEGCKSDWKDVFAVYSVRFNSQAYSEDGLSYTMEQNLRTVFWDMNEITYRTEMKEETAPVDGTVEEPVIPKVLLIIITTNKTADEMADRYAFDDSQRTMLSDLLSGQNADMMNSILYGVYGNHDDIVQVALSQVGNPGGYKYWHWYGFNYKPAWCAVFVSWCANECGYIDAGLIPKYAACRSGVKWFKERNQWLNKTQIPNAGMIIFYDRRDGRTLGQDGISDHTGIVVRADSEYVYTVEGNWGDKVSERKVELSDRTIMGYGFVA